MKRIRKSICCLLALVLLLSALPVTGFGVTERSGTLPRITRIAPQPRTGDTVELPEGVSLTPGNHVRWIDRISGLPSYAMGLYEWMESNIGTDGALVDFTKAYKVSSTRYIQYIANINDIYQYEADDLSEEAIMAVANDVVVQCFDMVCDNGALAAQLFDRDHPEVFWLKGEHLFGWAADPSYTISGNTVSIHLLADFFYVLKWDDYDIRDTGYTTTKNIKNGITKRDTAVTDILKNCPDTSIKDQLYYFNDTLTKRNAYNSAIAQNKPNNASRDAYECISALVGNSGTAGPCCEGYSKAFKILCDQVGIPCVLVTGLAKSPSDNTGIDHMWNNVQLDGQWYGVDVTYNDPYHSPAPTKKVSGYETEEWMLLGSESMPEEWDITFSQARVVLNKIAENSPNYTNGPVLSAEAYHKILNGQSVCYGDAQAPVTLQLYLPGADEPAHTISLNANKTNYNLRGVEPGTYTLIVSKEGHVTREYPITILKNTTLDTKISFLGDVTLDGRINVGDASRIYSHARSTNKITDEYALLCADITQDTRVNVGDVARCYSHARGTDPIQN